MPQTLNPEWTRALGADAERIHIESLHRPGNLTLSGYNQELWNHPFPTKRQRYAQSNIVLTRELAEYGTWGEAEIQQRGRKLADEAAVIWSGPTEPVAAPAPHDDDDSTLHSRNSMSVRTGRSVSRLACAMSDSSCASISSMTSCRLMCGSGAQPRGPYGRKSNSRPLNMMR
jgi:hypothetical protein